MANKRDRGARRAARAAGSSRRPPEVALARHLGVDGARLASPLWVACPAGAVVAVAAAQLGVVPRRLAALAAVVDAVESDPAGTVLSGSRCSATLDALAALASATGCVDTSAEGRWVSGWLAGELAWLRWADDAVEPWAPVDAAGPPGGVVAAAAAAALARRGDPALGAWASCRPRWAAAAVTGPAAVALVGPLAAALAAVDADGARRLLDTASRPPTGPEATWLAVTAASRSGVVPASPADADWAEPASGGEVWGDEDLEELDEEWDLGVDVAWEARGVTPALVEAMAAALDRWARWLAASSRQPQVKASQWQERWRASDVARLGAGVAAFCAGRHLRAGRHDAAAAVLDRAPPGPYPIWVSCGCWPQPVSPTPATSCCPSRGPSVKPSPTVSPPTSPDSAGPFPTPPTPGWPASWPSWWPSSRSAAATPPPPPGGGRWAARSPRRSPMGRRWRWPPSTTARCEATSAAAKRPSGPFGAGPGWRAWPSVKPYEKGSRPTTPRKKRWPGPSVSTSTPRRGGPPHSPRRSPRPSTSATAKASPTWPPTPRRAPPIPP